jgi:antitoxin ParD1/3/4
LAYIANGQEAMMVTRNVVLTDAQSALVDRMVRSGRFQNASEALRAGLRLLERDEAEFEAARAGVLEGLDQIRRGEFAGGTAEDAIRRAFDGPGS